MTQSLNWHEAEAPNLDVFETLAAAAWERLPAEFRQMCGNVVIRVEDFATDEILDEMGIDDPFSLTGLYQGVSLDRKSVSDVPREPDMVFLYRRAILDEWAEGGEELGHLIAHVLIHEIGHHFGFSDEDMGAIDDAVAAET